MFCTKLFLTRHFLYFWCRNEILRKGVASSPRNENASNQFLAVFFYIQLNIGLARHFLMILKLWVASRSDESPAIASFPSSADQIFMIFACVKSWFLKYLWCFHKNLLFSLINIHTHNNYAYAMEILT